MILAETIDLQTIVDSDGALIVAELDKHIGFPIKRLFTVSDVPVGAVRGGHAHKTTREILICVAGAVEVIATDGVKEETYLLDLPSKGLMIPARIWLSQRYMQAGTILLAICDTLYDEADYLRDYQAFLTHRRNG